MAETTLTTRSGKGSPLTNTEMDNNLTLLYGYTKGVLTKSLSAGTTTVTLTDTEVDNNIIIFTSSSTLVANVTVNIPGSISKPWTIFNNITAASNIQLVIRYVASGAVSAKVFTGKSATVFGDGTGIRNIGAVTSTLTISSELSGTSYDGSSDITIGVASLGITNAMLAGSIANNKLTNSSITVNGSSISLGGSATVTANTTNTLTIGSGLSGTSFNGSTAVTIAVDSTVALRADNHYIGTTSVALNRTSGNLALTGISSVTLPGSTSGTVQLIPTAAVGTGTVLTIPATTGTIVTTGDSGTVTSTMIADSTIVNGDISASAAIAITKLASSTISGVSLGNNLNTLTISSPLSGTSYNGSAAVSIGLASAYGDTQNPYASKTANYFLAAPNGAAGVPTFRAIVAADIPTLNQNTTGTAAGLSATLAVGSGGTGQTTVQAAMNAFAGAVTSGYYLRGNGTNVVMSAIQAADIPTLNQNTTGSSGSCTGNSATATNLAGGSAGTLPYQSATGTTAMLAAGSAGKVLVCNGTSAPKWGSAINWVMAINGMSGPEQTISGIPSWATRITIILHAISTTSTGVPTIRLGTSTSTENTGYVSQVTNCGSASVATQTSATSGFELVTSMSSSYALNGILTIFLSSNNDYVISGSVGTGTTTNTFLINGRKTLGSVLDRIQLTTTAGTDTFDGGSFTVTYE